MNEERGKKKNIKPVDEIMETNYKYEDSNSLDYIIEDTTENKEETVSKFGVVTGCGSLNVRKEPSLDSEIICVINLSTEVEIEENESTDEFYKICLPNGIEGYCMRKYIITKV